MDTTVPDLGQALEGSVDGLSTSPQHSEELVDVVMPSITSSAFAPVVRAIMSESPKAEREEQQEQEAEGGAGAGAGAGREARQEGQEEDDEAIEPAQKRSRPAVRKSVAMEEEDVSLKGDDFDLEEGASGEDEVDGQQWSAKVEAFKSRLASAQEADVAIDDDKPGGARALLTQTMQNWFVHFAPSVPTEVCFMMSNTMRGKMAHLAFTNLNDAAWIGLSSHTALHNSTCMPFMRNDATAGKITRATAAEIELCRWLSQNAAVLQTDLLVVPVTLHQDKPTRDDFPLLDGVTTYGGIYTPIGKTGVVIRTVPLHVIIVAKYTKGDRTSYSPVAYRTKGNRTVWVQTIQPDELSTNKMVVVASFFAQKAQEVRNGSLNLEVERHISAQTLDQQNIQVLVGRSKKRPRDDLPLGSSNANA